MGKDRKMILVNHRFFDGIHNRLQEGKSIVISNDSIESIEDHREQPADSEYSVVDLEGLTLLPGLIDNHVHIALPFIYRPSNRIAFEIKEQIKKNLRACITSGITTVRDVGAVPGWMRLCRSIVEKDTSAGPRVLTTNSALTAGNGCPDWVPYLNPLAKLFAGGEYKESPETPQQAERLVKKMVDQGADWIKVYYQSRSWLIQRQELPVFDHDTFKAIVDTANSCGRKVCCHAVWLDDLNYATSMGINSTEHSLLDAEFPEKTINDYLENDIALHPTLTYFDIMGNKELKNEFYGIVCERGDSFLEPESLRQVKEFYQVHLMKNYPPDSEECRKNCYDNVSLFERGYPVAMKNALKLHKAGGKVGVASDSGGSCMSYFGILYHEELKRMAEAGFSNYEVLKAATSMNARILDLDDRIGSLQRGKIADLVAVEGNPLEDISIMKNIKMVFKEGARVSM